MGEGVNNFKDLDVWKKGIDITVLVHEITEEFPKTIIWGLGAQMQRSSVSVSSNIAEGCERHHSREYIQFCYIALGSCAELETQMIIAKRRNYVTKENIEMLEEMINHERRMLKNLIKSLKKREN